MKANLFLLTDLRKTLEKFSVKWTKQNNSYEEVDSKKKKNQETWIFHEKPGFKNCITFSFKRIMFSFYIFECTQSH